MKDLKSQFKDWLKNVKGYSNNTVDNYWRSLERFDKYLLELSFWKHGVDECEQIKLFEISMFVSSLRDEGLEVRTCNNILSALRKYLRFCLIMWYKVIDYKMIEMWKEYKKKIWFLTEEEQRRLIQAARDDNTPELVRFRNLAIIYLLMYTWMRVSELADLKVEDIAEEMQICWKGWSLRPTYLMSEHLRIIRLYRFMREWKHIYSDYVFCSHSRNYPAWKMSRNSIENILRKLGEKAGIPHLFPHLLRHTFAKNLLDQWTNLYFIQQLLGHKSISTTTTYLGATNTELENEVMKLKVY